MAKTKENKEMSLESVLWNCRNDLRGVGSLDKNRDAVISLVFLKFAGDKFDKRRAEIIEKYGENPIFLEKASFYNADNVFYLDETSRWSYIVKNASSNNIAVILDSALKDIEDKNPSLQNTLPKNLFSTLGADKEKLKNLIDDINQINQSKFKENDLIGRVYEYFLKLYAASGTKEDGEFYTPTCVVKLIAELIEPYKGVVYDPCCGSGGMFVQSMKFVDEHKGNRKEISIIGQESNPETWRLCKMNLAIRGISNDLGTIPASTFTNDQHKDKTVDFIMANPPFNLRRWWDPKLENDPRWHGYGVPRESNANYAWILHMLSKLDVNHGIAGFLLANGALGDEDDMPIRKNVIESDKVEAIIVLPRDMFYTTDISVTLWILNMDKKAGELNGLKTRDRQGEMLFVDLRTWDQNVQEIKIDQKQRKKKTILTDEQIAEVKTLLSSWRNADQSKYHDVPEFCKSVRIHGEGGIASNNYLLAPSQYIEFINHDLDIDFEKEMQRVQKEMANVIAEEQKSKEELCNAFEAIGYAIK